MRQSVQKLGMAVAFAGFAAAVPSSWAWADGLQTVHRLSAEMANEAAREAVMHCAGQGYNETAVVVDADGVRQALLRGDRAGSHSLDSAFDKAYTSASFKADSGALAERAKTAQGFSALFTQVPHLILLGGGVVIKVGDEVVGAIGAAGAPGANLDEACARAGVEKIRDRLK
ncbi:MAG TPA: heme-binding protein [Acetobacteraceae bacterium]|nr:heme-binding protein [Acetobacteraceae bacterium]